MISEAQIKLIHMTCNAWRISRPVYVEILMESTQRNSCKQFTNQGQFDRAMAALEARAEIDGTWCPVRGHNAQNYWRIKLSQKNAHYHTDGGEPATSAQQQRINNNMRSLRTVHPRLKDDPEAAFQYLVRLMDNVTRGKCIMQSALTVTQGRAVVAALDKSLKSWTKRGALVA